MTDTLRRRHLDPALLMERERSTASAPWRSDDVAQVLIANAIGAVLVAVGAWVAHRQDTPGQQLGWINLSLAGLAVAGVMNGLWLSRSRRALRAAIRNLWPSEPAETWDSAAVNRPGSGELVSAPGTERYHRASCPLVAGRPEVIARSRGEHDRAGLRACEVCSP